jgi:hypothetical protein
MRNVEASGEVMWMRGATHLRIGRAAKEVDWSWHSAEGFSGGDDTNYATTPPSGPLTAPVQSFAQTGSRTVSRRANMKYRLALGAVIGVAAVFAVVATSRADPKLTDIPKHRHYVKTASGEMVPVGPDLCDNPKLQNAFNQFHNNLHVVSAAGIGPAAPGLHNFKGADLMAGPC